MRSFGCDAIYWMTSLFGIYMWRHERQVFIFFGTLTATIKKIQNTQKNAIINKTFLKQQHANCKVTQVLWISNWAVLLRLLKQDKSRTEGNPVNSSYNITLLLKYMIKRIKHGKIRITCRITLDQYHPSGLKALGLILVSSRWCLGMIRQISNQYLEAWRKKCGKLICWTDRWTCRGSEYTVI